MNGLVVDDDDDEVDRVVTSTANVQDPTAIIGDVGTDEACQTTTQTACAKLSESTKDCSTGRPVATEINQGAETDVRDPNADPKADNTVTITQASAAVS
jgi:hypothetical protein